MEQQLFYANYRAAKGLTKILLQQVQEAISEQSAVYVITLRNVICTHLVNLSLSHAFFKSIGKKCEIDILIIYYRTLLRRLDSS